MRIAFVTAEPPNDPLAWSGINFKMANSLQEQGIEIYPIGSLKEAWKPFFLAKHVMHKLMGHSYGRHREPAIGRGFARQIRAAVEGQNVDAIFSPSCTLLAYLDCKQPLVSWGDATFACLHSYYHSTQLLAPSSVRMGLRTEREAIKRLTMSIYASSWAADSALKDCGADAARVRVVPFGAIIPNPPAATEVAAAIDARRVDRCRLLFIGREWARKGGDIAVATAVAMNRAGLPTELHIVGDSFPESLPDCVKPTGFINKYTPEGAAKLDRLLLESHFLILPSRAEAFGMAPCEANAYGVPAMVTHTGGLAEVVRHGVNGYSFPLEASGEEYAKRFLEIMADRDRYRGLCQGARREYETRLNWDAAAKHVKSILEEAIELRPRLNLTSQSK